MFFEVDPELQSDYPPFQGIAARCLPHLDGSPRRSTYLAIYRVLEHVPVAALGRLHLATHDGRVLGLDASAARADGRPLLPPLPGVLPGDAARRQHARPGRILRPADRPSPAGQRSADRLCRTHPRQAGDGLESSDVGNLPYSGLQHLRECLRELNRKPGKPTKVTVRNVRDDVLYRTIQGGFYAGQGRELKFYPMPSPAELDSAHHEWWHSAQASYGS